MEVVEPLVFASFCYTCNSLAFLFDFYLLTAREIDSLQRQSYDNLEIQKVYIERRFCRLQVEKNLRKWWK